MQERIHKIGENRRNIFPIVPSERNPVLTPGFIFPLMSAKAAGV